MYADKSFCIGNVKVECPVVLAPMAGISDMPFRILCREQGAGMVCTEMISAKGIFYGNKNTGRLMQIDSSEHPISLQLFGSDPQIVSQMAAQIEEEPFDMLDLNMGCPVPKVVGNGEGSALMRDPHLAGELIRRTVQAIKKPVTVKIRKGFSEKQANAVELAKIAEDSGAAAVTVHPRTREQYYSGKADWETIRQVKEAVSIPVIGSGDVVDARTAEAMFVETGCDAVMIGRAARGNPWIFHQIRTYLTDGSMEPRPGIQEVCAMIRRHAQMMTADKGVYTGIHEMRKHVAWYTAGYPHSAAIRRRVNQVDSMEDLERLLEELTAQSAGCMQL